MGKGGGSGRGKGGCEAFLDGVVGMLLCGLFILLLGPILIAIGIAMFVNAGKNGRQNNIDSVNSVVNTWTTGSGPNTQNWANNQTFYLVITPALNSAQCTSNPLFNFSQSFTLSNQKTEYFSDDANNWNSVQQAALVTQLPTGVQGGCGWNMRILFVLDGANNSLTTYTLPSPVVSEVHLDPTTGSRYCPSSGSSLGSCSSSNANNCQNNCAAMGGVWSCSGSGTYSCIGAASVTQVCHKITRSSNTAAWRLDATNPNKNEGCSVPLTSIMRSSSGYVGYRLFGDQLFSVPNATVTSVPNTYINVVVRNSAEPWLTYMSVTDGNGSLGSSKSSLIWTGVVLVVVGGVITLAWIVAIYCCFKICCCGGMGNSRPQGTVDGRAWDVANRFGYVAPGVPVAGVPMGQSYPPPNPNYAYPPHPGYQQPYAYPPQGAYPYPPPQGGAYPQPPVQGNWQQPQVQQSPPQYPTVGKV